MVGLGIILVDSELCSMLANELEAFPSPKLKAVADEPQYARILSFRRPAAVNTEHQLHESHRGVALVAAVQFRPRNRGLTSMRSGSSGFGHCAMPEERTKAFGG